MKQHGIGQVSYDTEVGKITTDYRVLDVRRPFWSLGFMMDSGCNVHFTKNRCCMSKDDGKALDMIRSGGVFFVAARPFKIAVEGRTQSDDSSRGRASGDGEPTVASEFPRDLQRPQLKRERCMRLRDTCLVAAGVNGALRRERRTSHV